MRRAFCRTSQSAGFSVRFYPRRLHHESAIRARRSALRPRLNSNTEDVMPKYRNRLPQLSDKLFLTDGGLETTLIFHDKIELPYFASFDLLRSVEGTRKLRAYFERYIAMAKQ